MTPLLELPSERAARLHAEFLAEKKRLRWLLDTDSDLDDLGYVDTEDDGDCMQCGESFTTVERSRSPLTSLCQECDAVTTRHVAYFAAMED